MKITAPHVLFNQPITRRTYIWLLFLCPWAAAWIYLAARAQAAEQAKAQRIPTQA